MGFHIENAMQLLIIAICVYFGIKVTGKFIKFLLFVAVIVIAIYFLLDAGLINVPT